MNRAETYIKFAIYLAVILLVNIAGSTLFFRADLTEENIYSLSEASREAVSTLSEPMTIKVFFTEDLPAPYNNTKRYLRDMLEEYGIYANEYFNYQFYNVSPGKAGAGGGGDAGANQKLAESYGIRPVEIQSVEQDEIKFKKAYMGLVIIHGDLIEKIPAVTSTERIEYELTTAINKLNNKISRLAGLDEKVKVRFYMSSSLEEVAPYMGLDELPKLPDKVRSAVKKLNDKNYNKLAYEYLDPGRSEEKLSSLLESYDLMTLKWPDIPEENINAGRGAIGLVMEYKDKASTVQILSAVRLPIIGTRYELIDTGNLNEIINENIETLIGINENLGYLADHGTPALRGRAAMNQQQGGGLRNLYSHLSENYTIEEISLAEGRIPESLNCLVIAKPTEEFTDYELYKIDQALMRGTNIAVFSDAYQQMQTPPQQRRFRQPVYEPVDTGLEKLVSHYGVRIRDAYVMDKNCYKQEVPARAGGGEQSIYFAPVIKNKNINHDFEFMKNIKGMITLKNSPLETVDKRIKAQDIKVSELFSSSEKSWLQSERINLNPMFIRPPGSEDKLNPYPLAFLLEGSFESYFAGKPVPAKKSGEENGKKPEKKESGKKAGASESGGKGQKDSEKEGKKADLSKIKSTQDFREKGAPAKLAVVGSSDLLKDNLIDRKGKTPNSAFVLNLIDALNQREDIAVMRSKAQRFNPLHETSAFVKYTVKTANIAGLPVLVVVFGLFIWWRRRIRRKHIQMMFQT